ncbi:Basic endochitinase C [Triticum urartu]|uniref:chitinase n=1 Tax=Triticum urartu TaxID=4572 RepID=M7ZH98_TRIUA|nr:Basic endochitinase C [Triticum urartu]
MLSWNYNYGPAGRAIGVDLLNNPDLVATDATVSFETALCTGRGPPAAADNAAGRVPGYGVITNIINGGLECGRGQDSRVADRIGFYQRYCNILGVGYGSNLDCYNQRPFVEGLLIQQVTQ